MDRIAGQLLRVKRRINLLAVQQMVFSTFALLLGTAGVLVIAAFFLTTAHFLALGLALLILLLVCLPLAVRRAMRRFAKLRRTAAIIDERVALNSRLSTLLAMATEESKYSLWPFLVEDTLSRLDDFHPSRVEKRRISPAIYGFAAACLIASLAGLMAYSARMHQEALRKVLKSLTLDVDPSEIGPSDSATGQSAEVEGDPDTLRSLADRLESANQAGHGSQHNTFNRLSQRARDMASSLQDRLTGRDLRDTPEKVKIRLAQALGDKPPVDENDSGTSGDSEKSQKPGSGDQASASNGGSQRPQAGQQHEDQANNDSGSSSHELGTTPNSPPAGSSFDNGGPRGPGAGDAFAPGHDQGSTEEASGQSAGGGSDPEHLMGPPDAPSHKNENFEIMIDARLSDRSPIASAQPYVPPKVKTSLNIYQHPDEPLDRGTVPPADRVAVKRVFER